jgi:hypothetical protein
MSTRARSGRAGRRAGGRPARTALAAFTALAALTALPTPASAQALLGRMQARDGKVRMSYATRPGVCGVGHNIQVEHASEDWESECEPGPARLVLQWRDGALADVDTYVGGRWREAGAGVTDLGTVSAPEAANALLDLAVKGAGRAENQLIFAATLADSVEVWPRLLTIARDEQLPRATRKDAVFWLGQAAGDRVVEELAGLASEDNADREIQQQAVFALSQLRDGAGVPKLIEIARTHEDPRVRKTAMFWLGQSNDPRAIALFEEILTGR